MYNDLASQLFRQWSDHASQSRCAATTVGGANLIDAGAGVAGSLEGGILLARLCLADSAKVTIGPCDREVFASDNLVHVRTDDPLNACLGSQYAGWPVQSGDFFAMGSGPMRLLRGREEMLKELELSEQADQVVGVLESESLPDESTIEVIANECGIRPSDLRLAIAPSTCIAGSVQVVARSIETSLHKLHELGFDVRTVVSGTGAAPLPPPAKRGDVVGGIGRTNDAILYGATVSLWTDCEDDAISEIAEKVPSVSSLDHGQPFAKVFKNYEYDFYKVDPLLFSPAVVTIHNLRSGRSWSAGKIVSGLLHQSFTS